MRFISVTQPGGPGVLEISSGPTPVPREHEVLIQVEAAGINRPDILQREGKYPPPPGASPILGLEVAGKVAVAGPGSKWKAGDSVCALVPGGGYAEYCIAPDVQCLPVPAGLSIKEAAGIPEAYFTVWTNVFQRGRLQSGESILIHGGTSGIGTTAIQLAHALGSRVFATAGSREKCEACLRFGADGAINYKEVDFASEIRQLTSDRGVDVILDMVGAPYTVKNLDSLNTNGRLVQIAVQQGASPTINLAKIMMKRLTLTGSTLRPRSISEKGQIAVELQRNVWPLLETGKVKVVVDRTFPFEQVAEAHRYFESGRHIGKVILEQQGDVT